MQKCQWAVADLEDTTDWNLLHYSTCLKLFRRESILVFYVILWKMHHDVGELTPTSVWY